MRILRLFLLLTLAPFAFAQYADLRVSLAMPPTAIYSGTSASARGTMTLTNAGNAPAQNVTLDFGGQVSAGSLPGLGIKCTGSPTPTHCTADSLVPGTWTFPVYADWYGLTAAGEVETTSVTVSSPSTPDPDLTNNTASANTTIIAQYNATFDSLSVPSAVAVGKIAAITASYGDNGPTPAEDLTLTISIPPGLRYEGFYAQDWVSCNEPPAAGHGDLVCKPGIFGLDPKDSVEALVSVDPSVAPGTVLTVHGTLASPSALPSPLSASGDLTVAAPTSADAAAVSVAATVDQPSVVITGPTYLGWITEKYTITNTGPRDADIVTLDMRLPNDCWLQAATTTLGSCSGTGPLHCVAATLRAGATMTVTVPVRAATAGTFTSTVVVTWLNGGPVAASSSFEALWVRSSLRRSVRH